MIANFRRGRYLSPAVGLVSIVCALMCPPAWPAGPILTHEQLERLLKVVESKGTHTKVPPAVASMLHFEPKQLTPDIKEAAFLDDDGVKHGFAPLNDGSGFFMFRSTPSFGHSVYHVNSKLQLVRAARGVLKQPLKVLSDEEGEKELSEEYVRWSKALSPNGPVEQSPFRKGAAPDTPKPLISTKPPDSTKPFISTKPPDSTKP
jgi:hypothetical protein